MDRQRTTQRINDNNTCNQSVSHMVTYRSTLMMGYVRSTTPPSAMAAETSGSSKMRSSRTEPLVCVACAIRCDDDVDVGPAYVVRNDKSRLPVLARGASRCLSRSARPITSSRLLQGGNALLVTVTGDYIHLHYVIQTRLWHCLQLWAFIGSSSRPNHNSPNCITCKFKFWLEKCARAATQDVSVSDNNPTMQ